MIAFKKHGDSQPKTFAIKFKGQRTAKVWFHSWFRSDPSADEILAQYLKVSGRQANPAALKSYLAKGTFELKNDAPESIGETLDGRRQLVHIHWAPDKGELEFSAQAPDKYIFTQTFDDRLTFQRGTNGATGWWRRTWGSDPASTEPGMQQAERKGPLGGVGLTDLKRGCDFINFFQLENSYSGLYLAGTQLVGDRVAYEVQNRNGMNEAVSAMYFDVETGMLLRFDSYRHEILYNRHLEGFSDYNHNGSSDFSQVFLEDYRDVNGVQIPFRIRQLYQDIWITTTITDFSANPTIDPAVFEDPSPGSPATASISTQ